MKIRALIIDDEPKSRENLSFLLREYCPSIELFGEASSPSEGLKLIITTKPDLIFLDIEMQEGSGFELLKALNPSISIEVIFVTAYDKYGIQAAKACAIDYILKPIDIFDLTKAVEKAERQIAPKIENRRLKELVANIDRKEEEKRIAISLSDKIEFVPLHKIIRLEANGNYTTFHLEGTNKIMASKTLKEFQDILEPLNFLRTHQSHLVNLKKIQSYIKSDGGYILMNDGAQIPISRHKKEDVMKRIL